ASMAADDASVHAPGPALYWLLALPARIGAHWWQPALVGLLAVAVFVAVCVIVDDLAGRFAAVPTGIVLVLVVRSVAASKLVQPINPYVGLVLLVATWFLAWRVATGRPRTYPLLIAAASLTAQMHLAYAVPVALTVVVASAGLLLPVLIARRRDPAPPPTPPWRWVLAGAGTGLLHWAAPTGGTERHVRACGRSAGSSPTSSAGRPASSPGRSSIPCRRGCSPRRRPARPPRSSSSWPRSSCSWTRSADGTGSPWPARPSG